MRHIPDWTQVRFKQDAKRYRKVVEDLRDAPYQWVKDQIANGTAVDSFTSSLIERNESPTLYEEETYKWAAAGIYSGRYFLLLLFC